MAFCTRNPGNVAEGIVFEEGFDGQPIADAAPPFTMGIRQMPHLVRHPRDLLYLPAFVFVATYLQFIRFYALLTIHQVDRWGTRKGADASRRAEPRVQTVLDRRHPNRKKQLRKAGKKSAGNAVSPLEPVPESATP